MWMLFAFGSALFAGLTAILAKCGVRQTDSTVATAIRTVVVLAFSWVMVFLTGAQSGLEAVGGRTLLFLVLSGLATGASWLCYFRALQLGGCQQVDPRGQEQYDADHPPGLRPPAGAHQHIQGRGPRLRGGGHLPDD